ncbi:hypothetical protein [Halalkalibacter oceani]|uniref:hypothetical protein n=1 Tax=Halalkalibacter oceani TaxID=1653776 RepID=UPI003398051E
MNNHGKVGEAVLLKFTSAKINEMCGKSESIKFPNKTTLSPEELSQFFSGLSSALPVLIDEDTKGDYEVVCKHGVEVHYFNK